MSPNLTLEEELNRLEEELERDSFLRFQKVGPLYNNIPEVASTSLEVTSRRPTRPRLTASKPGKPEDTRAATTNKPRIINEKVLIQPVRLVEKKTPALPPTPPPSRSHTPPPPPKPAQPPARKAHRQILLQDGVTISIPPGVTRFRATVKGRRYALRINSDGTLRHVTTQVRTKLL